MPRLTWQQLQEYGRQGVIPPRHPTRCPQNMVRLKAVIALQHGEAPEQVRLWVERELASITHTGHG